MIIGLSIALGLSVVANVLLAVVAFRYAKIIFSVEDQVNDSLDMLDASYKSLNKILATPVMYDDPQIKQAIRELKTARDAVLTVANRVTTNMTQRSE